jgi:hypothetical protein
MVFRAAGAPLQEDAPQAVIRKTEKYMVPPLKRRIRAARRDA